MANLFPFRSSTKEVRRKRLKKLKKLKLKKFKFKKREYMEPKSAAFWHLPKNGKAKKGATAKAMERIKGAK